MSDGRDEIPSLRMHYKDGVADFVAPVYEATDELDNPKPYGTDFPLCKNCGKPYLDHIDVDYGASGLELCPDYAEYEPDDLCSCGKYHE